MPAFPSFAKLAACTMLVAAALCQPAAAKSVSLIPIACSSPDVSGQAILLRQGSDYTLGLSGTGNGAYGNWRFLFVVDGGAEVLVDVTINSLGPGFNLSTTATLAKGHIVSLNAQNLNNGISCSFQVSTSRV
jgi:hypothetical protein